MRSSLLMIIPIALLAACASVQPSRAPIMPTGIADNVDTFIGTDGTGHTFPGPVAPFGMIQPGPDGARTGWAHTSGYQFGDGRVLGFSQTRISGAGVPELGDVLLLPYTDLADPVSGASIDKASETARPGYYTVRLSEDDIRMELTAGERVAMHRYTFPAGGRVRLLVDLGHGLTFGDRQRVVSADATIGEDAMGGTVISSNWVDREMHFALRFDELVAAHSKIEPDAGQVGPLHVLEFDLPDADPVLEVMAAVSTVSVDGAKANLATQATWDFDGVARGTHASWNDQLGRLTIQADPKTERLFYSALYRAMIHPSRIDDVDGKVRGPQGEIIEVGRPYYSTLSLWDTFRASHPLFTIVAPERVDDFVATMLDHHDQQGYLPLWAAWGRETHTMIGNPALPVIADAASKGFDGFDQRRALDAMVKTSTEPHRNSEWDIYDRYGYFPYDRIDQEAVSKTLEAGIGDAAVARIAELLGDTQTAERFTARSQSYRKLFDPETGHMRGRDSQGRWREPFDPLRATSPLNNPGDYTEANAWQYLWTPALHDVEGLIELLGGRAAFTAKLDEFFELEGYGESKFLGQEALIGQYAHGNEPSHHVAWLYAFSDKPERTAQLVHEIATRFYADTPDGIIGNDDAGQMSAWYVFAALGFYPVDPIDGTYVIIEPMVQDAQLALPGRETLDLSKRLGELRGSASAVVVNHADIFGRAMTAN